MRRTAIPALSLTTALAAWWGASQVAGAALLPTPFTVFAEIGRMIPEPSTWTTLTITVARGMAGLAAALLCALVLGTAAGSHPRAMRFFAPLVAVLQSCPPILWITLLMVWAGTGTVVPVAVVFATLFPPLFANIAQGRLALDRRLLDMARFYRVPRHRALTRIVLPGLVPYLLAGLSHAASTSWKVTTMAEFLGSSSGIGARIFWSYRMLEMPRLFAWAGLVVLLGTGLELVVIAPLRRAAATYTGRVREQA